METQNPRKGRGLLLGLALLSCAAAALFLLGQDSAGKGAAVSEVSSSVLPAPSDSQVLPRQSIRSATV